MIEPKLIATALTQKNPSGFPAYTKSQVADLAIKEDSVLGQRIRKAMDLGVTKEQAIKYFAFGSANGPQEEPQYKPSFFSRFAQGVADYASAPLDAAAGGVMKGISKIPGMEAVANAPEVQNLSENLSQTADVARVGVPVVAGLATGGASIPVSAAISGGASALSSLGASGLEALAGEKQSLGGAMGEAATTGVASAALDAATMGLFRLAKPFLKAKGAAQLSDEAAATTGKIIQGTDEEIKIGQQAMRSIPVKGDETYSSLHQVMEKKIDALKGAQNELLDSFPARKTLNQLGTTVTVGNRTATDNFVKSALDGLEELYQKTGNTQKLLETQLLRETAEDPLRGLTVRQLNELAREYGRGFKAFSDASGQPLTSVNAKLYETVRKGLKNTLRSQLPNDASKTIDEEMSNLIHTSDLVKEMVDKVQLLSNKVGMRRFGDKIGSFIGKVVNASSFGTAGGFVRGITPSDIGQKTLNSLRIQEHLPKNLAKLNKLLQQIDNLPEGQVLGRLKEIFGDVLEQGTKATTKAGVGLITNSANQ